MIAGSLRVYVPVPEAGVRAGRPDGGTVLPGAAVCAAAGLGRLTVVACERGQDRANASKEANRTEAGLEKLAAKILAEARGGRGRRAGRPRCRLLALTCSAARSCGPAGAIRVAGRAGAGCLESSQRAGGREAARRAQGQA